MVLMLLVKPTRVSLKVSDTHWWRYKYKQQMQQQWGHIGDGRLAAKHKLILMLLACFEV